MLCQSYDTEFMSYSHLSDRDRVGVEVGVDNNPIDLSLLIIIQELWWTVVQLSALVPHGLPSALRQMIPRDNDHRTELSRGVFLPYPGFLKVRTLL